MEDGQVDNTSHAKDIVSSSGIHQARRSGTWPCRSQMRRLGAPGQRRVSSALSQSSLSSRFVGLYSRAARYGWDALMLSLMLVDAYGPKG